MKNPFWWITRLLAALAILTASHAAVRLPYVQVTAPLLNIDFGAHLNPGFPSGQGPLAIGKGTNDYWNLYSRDGANMFDWLANNQKTNLLWSDGQSSNIRLTVTNAPGAWYTSAQHDAVFSSYLYPQGPGNILAQLSNLPRGTYEVYIYAHAGVAYGNSVIHLTTSSANYYEKSTSTISSWDDLFYVEGNHYVRFQDVRVMEGDKLNILVKPGSDLPYLNAVQIVQKSSSTDAGPPPSNDDLFDIRRGTVITSHSGVWPGSKIEAMFGGLSSGPEQLASIFNGPFPRDGFTNYVEWRTEGPVRLEGFRLYAAGDGPELLNEREFKRFVLKTKSPGSDIFDLPLYSYTATHPYQFINETNFLLIDASITPTTGQVFRAEFIQFAAGRGYDGPRILELDGFGGALSGFPVITKQPEDANVLKGDAHNLRVEATGPSLQFQWLLNGKPIPNATSPTFQIASASLADGGVYSVRVTSPAASLESKSVVVTVRSRSTLYLDANGPVQEGSFIPVNLVVVSDGDIAAASLILKHDAFLATPEIAWTTQFPGMLTQMNTNPPGTLRLSFAQATTLPPGTNVVATLTFRARSIPQPLVTVVSLSVPEFSDASGNRAPGFESRALPISLTKRKIIGDNNANDRLDVADGSIIMRLLTLNDAPHSWDAAANDLNENTLLDSGDVVRLLRVVVGLDPQPTGTNNAILSSLALDTERPAVRLEADPGPLVEGQKLKVRVQLAARGSAISGVSFRVDYPLNALRLEEESSLRPGSAIPHGAFVLSNSKIIEAAGNTGSLLFAASSAEAWPAVAGEITELSFVVLDPLGYTPHVAIRDIDLSDGWQVRRVRSSSIGTPIGEAPSLSVSSSSGGFIGIQIAGGPGSAVRIESSTDLVNWTELSTVSSEESSLKIGLGSSSMLFYRAVRLE